MIGKWIDQRSDIERDRIIEAQHWMAGDLEHAGQRCLVGHALGVSHWVGFDIDFRHIAVTALRFDALVARFGLPRIVRAVKLRAARSSIVHLTQVVR